MSRSASQKKVGEVQTELAELTQRTEKLFKVMKKANHSKGTVASGQRKFKDELNSILQCNSPFEHPPSSSKVTMADML